MLHKSHHIKTYVTSIPFFIFWFLVTFGDEVTKLQKHYVIYVYLLQGKIEKNGKKIKHLKRPKYQKPKRRKFGIKTQTNKILKTLK